MSRPPLIAPEVAVNTVLSPRATAADRKKLLGVMTLLAYSPSGAPDAQLVVDNAIEVEFDMREGGAGFQPYRRKILLNRMHTAARTATEFIHEATHARAFVLGGGADLSTDDRDEFVAKMLAEETETYFREAIVGREMMHIARGWGDPVWREFLTAHQLQMYFQLVHGVPYKKRPPDDVLAIDLALSSGQLGDICAYLRPYFARYVTAYGPVEAIKWDIANGLRAPMANSMLSELLSASFSRQDPSFSRPMRPAPSNLR